MNKSQFEKIINEPIVKYIPEGIEFCKRCGSYAHHHLIYCEYCGENFRIIKKAPIRDILLKRRKGGMIHVIVAERIEEYYHTSKKGSDKIYSGSIIMLMMKINCSLKNPL